MASGPSVFKTDITIGKRIRTLGPINAEFQLMIFNVFNNVNFNPVGGTFAYSAWGRPRTATRSQAPSIQTGRCRRRSA